MTTGVASTFLAGDNQTTAMSHARHISDLNHRLITSVSIGDFHQAALSAGGKVYTWGRNLAGALGVWNNPLVQKDQAKTALGTPTQVIFDPSSDAENQPICICISAAGWQTAALVLDLKRMVNFLPPPYNVINHTELLSSMTLSRTRIGEFSSLDAVIFRVKNGIIILSSERGIYLN